MFSGGGGGLSAVQGGRLRLCGLYGGRQGLGREGRSRVERDGKRLSHVSCADEPVSQLGPDLADKAGLQPDAGDFDLP
ncbi:MAG: hypothetical protein WDN69_10215 [Aliidongia sp.]